MVVKGPKNPVVVKVLIDIITIAIDYIQNRLYIDYILKEMSVILL